MKRHFMAMFLAVSISMGILCIGAWADTIFTDVEEGSWYEEYVQYCYDNGLMNGTGSSTFEPGTATTRNMVIQTLYNLYGAPDVSGSSSFHDVVSGAWYEDALIWGENFGIAQGYGNGNFGPSDIVTREQMATFFYRYAGLCGYDVSDSADLSGYTDEDEISDWALPYVSQ